MFSVLRKLVRLLKRSALFPHWVSDLKYLWMNNSHMQTKENNKLHGP
jgi:hypothetical protein